MTSGIDGIYPAGLAVATVTSILQNPESPFAKIVSTPVAEVTNHLQLLLLELPEVQETEIQPVQPESKSTEGKPDTKPVEKSKDKKPHAAR